MENRSRRVPWSFLGGVILFLLLVASTVLVAPRVEQVIPESGSTDVPSSTSIQIVFNRDMEIDSVETRLSLDPNIPGSFSWEGRTLTFSPEQPWPPGATVTLHLASGSRSKAVLPIIRSQTWSFRVGETRILYLWPDGGRADLYTRSLDGGETKRLTDTPFGVLDFSLGPDGRRILYAAMRQDGGSELRELDLSSGKDRLVYACPQQVRCQALAYAADGEVVAFERFGFPRGADGKSLPGPSRVWGLRLSENGDAFPIGVAAHVSSIPEWSPTGLLAYYDATLRAIALVDVELGPEPTPENYIPNDLGLVGSWSPDGSAFIYAAIVFPQTDPDWGDQVVFYSHLYRMDTITGRIVDLAEEEVDLVEDAAPSFSPDGAWIAFTRKYLEEHRWTMGRQLWLMRSDGFGARQLTDDADFHISSLAWSPDSGALAYVRKNQMDITEPVEIWWIDIDSREASRLISGGYSPQWIP
ncbi:MAG: hypothetical protein GTO14_20560 [Anaerolineales bacterium]|nr:hypothetical protein [Anaerolineales bacterium]